MADLCRELPSQGWDTVLGLTQGAVFNIPDRYTEVHRNLSTIEVDGTLGTRTGRLRSLKNVIRKVSPDVVLSMRVFDVLEAVSLLKSVNQSSAPRLVMGIRAFESPYFADLRRFRENIDFCVTSGNLIADACYRVAGIEADRVESIGGGVKSPSVVVYPRNPGSTVRLLYAGRLEQTQKRVLDLIEFVRCLKHLRIDFRLDVCGTGPEELNLIQELRPLIDAGRISFHGWVSEAELYSRYYPNADCFIHFAAWEGITISPREAMAHGVVPVISEFSGLHSEKQFLNGINALTFPVGRPDMAAMCVKSLTSTPGLFTKLSQAAMDSQTGRYSFAGSIDAWRDVLNKSLSLPPKSGSFPRVPERIYGRLSRLGVPASLQHWARSVFNRPIRFADPGSEWPTSSGLMTKEEHLEIMTFGDVREAEEKRRCSGTSLPESLTPELRR